MIKVYDPGNMKNEENAKINEPVNAGRSSKGRKTDYMLFHYFKYGIAKWYDQYWLSLIISSTLDFIIKLFSGKHFTKNLIKTQNAKALETRIVFISIDLLKAVLQGLLKCSFLLCCSVSNRIQEVFVLLPFLLRSSRF